MLNYIKNINTRAFSTFFLLYFTCLVLFFMMETALNTYSSLVENLLPFLRNRSRGSYIGLAILALVLRRTYSFLTPPKNLRQFPKLSFFTVARSFASCEPVNTRFKRLILPLIKDNQSYYTVNLFLGVQQF